MPAKSKKKSGQYHLRRDDVPEDAGKLQEAMNLHCRLLMGLIGAASLPESPSEEDIKAFEERFDDASKINSILRESTSSPESLRKAEASIRELRKKVAIEPRSSKTAKNITSIPENHLCIIFTTIYAFGLKGWRPDFFGTPTSLYNGALETIALWIAHLEVHMGHLGNAQLLKMLYHNFIWSHMKDLVLKELRKPGSVAGSIEVNKAYKRHLELSERRTEHLWDDGYNSRIQHLTEEPECNSDDEANPDGPGFLVFPKPARSTQIFKPEPRVPHPQPRESNISRQLPAKCPLDWFHPGYFNRLSVRLRAKYIYAPIALPSAEDILEGQFDWKSMPEVEFMAKYGNKVKKLYILPTAKEIEALNDEGEGEEEGGDQGEGGSGMNL
ncbi:hypothetical protein CCMSSC00406_0004989 [Pleurotus cornucopiae]|uniref:Uncharacterized protein n=1 Tax=Pleurotus cornucopiae TaxID=5321 RepID=A0ACB7J9L0_PLECO|nr:hypothetical protein CCMSSC00406_0004989 [Pleurotus cornucopiae]